MSVKQDLRTHIKLLDSKEKLHRITKSVNKDTELMPLVRWQFRGLEEEQRRGFLFENVTDSRGRTFFRFGGGRYLCKVGFPRNTSSHR